MLSDPKTNHYVWLEKHLPAFARALGLPYPDDVRGLISAHGDKGYSYRTDWANAGIPFAHGMAIFLLTYERPYSKQVRETENGWVDTCQWVIDNYPKFKPMLSLEDI